MPFLPKGCCFFKKLSKNTSPYCQQTTNFHCVGTEGCNLSKNFFSGLSTLHEIKLQNFAVSFIILNKTSCWQLLCHFRSAGSTFFVPKCCNTALSQCNFYVIWKYISLMICYESLNLTVSDEGKWEDNCAKFLLFAIFWIINYKIIGRRRVSLNNTGCIWRPLKLLLGSRN